MATTQATVGTASFSDRPLSQILRHGWWLLLLRGIALILFGILAFAWPGLTLLTLVLFWGAYAAADGILALVSAFSSRGGSMMPRWWLILVGITGIAVGALCFIAPRTAVAALLTLIAAWAMVVGIAQIAGAVTLRNEIEGEWMLLASGFLAIAFGAIVILQPVAGALSIAWLIASYAILGGVCLVGLSFRVKRLKAA